MSLNKVELLEKALKRERIARKEAEKILEKKSLELFRTNQNLIKVLNQKELELASLFNTIVDPYILMDLYGNVLKMNKASVDFVGYDTSIEVFNVKKIVYKEDLEEAFNLYKKVLKTGVYKNLKVRIYDKNKNIRWIELNSGVVNDENNKPVFIQSIFRDITDNLNAQKERDALVKNLTLSNQELKDFAHVVSHDLKAPLRSMNTLVTWLEEDCEEFSNQNIKDNFKRLLKKIDKMDHLISGILKYASVDRVENNKKLINLQKVVNVIIATIHIPKHIDINIIKELPIIQGDKFRLHQLFQNLISNAIKYCDKEKGYVNIDFKEVGDMWEFKIEDNGVGIKEKYHKKVFEIFQTLDERENATGIGLSIVKKILMIYGGDVWINSEHGKGTTFYFTLPK